MMSKYCKSIIGYAVCVVVLLGSGLAMGADYQSCFKWQIQTADSNRGIAAGPDTGLTEDWYRSCDQGCSVRARGVRVRISRGSWARTFDAHPVSGCVNWSHSASSGFTIRVYGYATDAAGNFVRIHNSPDSFQPFPGQTYSILLTGVTPTPGGSNRYTVGSNVSRWTAMAALGFGLYRYHYGLEGRALHVGLSPNCGGNSAHFGTFNNGAFSSNAAITSGRHYLRLGDCQTGNPGTRRKFTVAHELGHAIAALYYGQHSNAVDSTEPGVSSSHSVNPDACSINGAYSIGSKEWNSIAFRESWAHFIAARIWNNKNRRGTFTWFGSPTDLERYGPSLPTASGANAWGGRLENFCCVPSAANNCAQSWRNAGTIGDWLRFLWDLYTSQDPNEDCSVQPNARQMLDIYSQTRRNGGLGPQNYEDRMYDAFIDLGVPTCLADVYLYYQVRNGADH